MNEFLEDEHADAHHVIMQMQQRIEELEGALAAQQESYKALQQEHRRLMGMIQQLPALLYLQADDYSIPFANRYFCDHFGTPGTSACYGLMFGRTEPCRGCPPFRMFGQQQRDTLYVWEATMADGQTYQMYNIPFQDEGGASLVMVLGIDITKRVRVEHERRRRERRYQRLLRTVTDYVYMVEVADGRPVSTFHGPGCVNVTGYESGEFLQDEYLWWRMVYPEDREAVEEQAAEILRGVIRSLEHRLVHKDGSIRWVRNTPVPYYDADGRLVAYDGLITDITVQKQQEAAILQSEATFRMLIESHGDPIMVLRDGIVCFVNPSAEVAFGRSSAELLGQELGFPVIDTRAELDFLSKGGHISVAEMRVTEIEWEGSPSFLLSFRDITEHKRAEEELEQRVRERTRQLQHELGERERAEAALRESEERYRSMFENATVGMFRATPDGSLLVANPALAQMSGYESGMGMVEAGVNILAQFCDQEGQRQACHDLLSGGFETVTIEDRYRCHDRSMIVVHLTMWSKRDEMGHVRYLEGFIEDVTERKRIEEVLQQAKEVAEAATRAKSQFLANISHELRTPLNAIIGMTTLLSDSQLEAEHQECIDIIHESSESLLASITDILEFSRIESGGVSLDRRSFSLPASVEEVLHQVAIEATQKGLELSYSIDEQLPCMLVGDVGRLQQVMLNLLKNAVKFTETGEISVVVEPWQRSSGMDGRLPIVPRPREVMAELPGMTLDLHIAVRDTGIGMSAEEMGSMFQSFSQVDASSTRRYGGSGLGLAISKGLVEMMGGTIWVESEVGVGSIFHVMCPFEAVGNGVDVLNGGAWADGEQNENIPEMSILLVENNRVNQHVVYRLLERLGYHADVVKSGMEALAALERHTYDVVLMDIQMPEMDGIEATRCIRMRWPKSRQPYILAMTAYALDEYRRICLASGMNDYISKPVRLDDLQAALTKAKEWHRARHVRTIHNGI